MSHVSDVPQRQRVPSATFKLRAQSPGLSEAAADKKWQQDMKNPKIARDQVPSTDLNGMDMGYVSGQAMVWCGELALILTLSLTLTDTIPFHHLQSLT